MLNPLLEIKDVNASYGPIQALRKVSVTIYPKEIVTLIGANGAGKTTLLNTLFNQPKIESGEILFDGQTLTDKPTHQIAHLGITISPEGRRIFPKMTVMENLQMGALVAKDKKRYQSDLDHIFDLFSVLKNRMNQRAGTLSGGEQQMLAIGRALMGQPRLLLLDEPSLGLAPQIVKKIFKILRDIRELGTTLFLVEQNANHALQLADRGYVLVNGEIKLEGKGDFLLHHPDIKKAYLEGG
jgi:branched-chain amino acid transport system ATP-binding protein